MFDDSTNNQTDQTAAQQPGVATESPLVAPDPMQVQSTPADQSAPALNFPTTMAFSSPADSPQPTMMSQQAYSDTITPSSAPVTDDSTQLDNIAASEPDFSMPELPAAGDATINEDSSTTSKSDETADDLLGIKQSALQQLAPLIGKLEQTNEEKFRTTMMMIQASDDESLIKTAYESAQLIEDEKVKAQALLDIINEINYFTQPHDN
jgi:hypothetical protein